MLPFAAAVAIGTIYLRLTVIAMSLVSTELETGYYATSFRVVEVIVAVPPLVVGATLPVLARAARDDERRLQYVLQRLFDATLIVGAGIGLVVALGAPFAVEVLAGGESDPSIRVLRIQAIAIVANFVATSWGYGLLSLHRHRSILFASVAALVTGLGLIALLVPDLEAEGAALAYVGGELVLAALMYLLLTRAQPGLHLSLRVPVRVAAAAALAGAVALVPGLPSAAGRGGRVGALCRGAVRPAGCSAGAPGGVPAPRPPDGRLSEPQEVRMPILPARSIRLRRISVPVSAMKSSVASREPVQ